MARLRPLLLLVVLLLAVPSAGEEPTELAVIVHPSRAHPLEAAEIRRIYLKQRRFWPDGSAIVAINREDGSLRRAFDRLLDDEPARLGAYWNQRYFEGVFPPITLASDEAIRRYVASRPNAVGYIDARAVDASVSVAFRMPLQPRPAPTR